jgi:carboxylesterase
MPERDFPLIVPGDGPAFHPGGPAGCLLLHGFSAMPGEMALLAEDLAARGHTVLNWRLAGHATHPDDLARVRWTDWLASVEDGLAVLRGCTRRQLLVGQSMGGMVALTAAAHTPVAGVVAFSTPCPRGPGGPDLRERLGAALGRTVRKGVAVAPPPLQERREAGYPAYPQFPARILLEMDALAAAFLDALPRVTAPALLIHSRTDGMVGIDSLQRLYDRIGSRDKTQMPLDGMDHSLVRDPQRQVVFDAVAAFVARVAAAGTEGA